MTDSSLEPNRTAVLSLDLQAGIVAAYLRPGDAMLSRVHDVQQRARDRGFLLVHARVGFRPGCPEISARNVLFKAIKESPQHQRLFEGAAGAFHPAVAPRDNEIVVTKSRVSAFAGTDLDVVLRAHDITTVVLFGVATSGVVLSTLLDAADRDYGTVVIADCCADADAKLHDCLVERLFAHRAVVISAEDFPDKVGRDVALHRLAEDTPHHGRREGESG